MNETQYKPPKNPPSLQFRCNRKYKYKKKRKDNETQENGQKKREIKEMKID